MTGILPLSIGLIIAGLVICLLSDKTGKQLLTTVLYWIGVIVTVLGVVLFIAPVIVWLSAQLRSMLGV